MKQSFQFLDRFPEEWLDDNTLLILDEDAQGLAQLQTNGDFQVFSLHQHNHEQAQSLGLTSHFGFDLQAKFSKVVIDWPKAKQLGELLVSYAATILDNDAQLLIIGSNKGGIKSVAKRLAQRDIASSKLSSANHCALLAIDAPQAEFDLNDWWQSWQYQETTVYTLPGVFSAQKLDRGTALLLEQLPPLSGEVLDFGCGCGIIGLTVAHQSSEAQVTMLDNNLMAVLSAQRNIQESGLSNITVKARNGLAGHPRARFRHVVTNPPFHEGQRTNTDMSKAFLADMAKLMHLKGQVWAVANEFLAYEETLLKYFKGVKRIAKDNGFKILLAQIPIVQKR